nr:unnamed protein product [Spirometra erinaceieuropaei]
MSKRSETYEYCPRVLPHPDVEYPLNVQYCGECSMPIEYCEFSHCPEKCKQWLEKNLPEVFEQLSTVTEDTETKKKSRQVRGGKGSGVKKPVQQKITLFRASRGKNKFTTSVIGLDTFGIDLKVASKFFGQKFATGSSATSNSGEIVIQGDVKDDLLDLIPDKWPEIPMDAIEDLGDMKR